nr:MAG TPA: hypothetical protein [Bacteriophage sp.]
MLDFIDTALFAQYPLFDELTTDLFIYIASIKLESNINGQLDCFEANPKGVKELESESLNK